MQTKLKRKSQFGEESIESKPRNKISEPTSFKDETKELWTDLLKSTRQDIVGGSLSSVSEQLLGSFESDEQQLSEGREMVLETKKNQEKIQARGEHMGYVRRDVMNVERTGETKVEMEVKRGVEEIRAEIQKLVKTSKLVERTVKDATAEQAPVRPGKYHLSFFEFVLGVIRDATRKLEDTVHFGAVFTSKKQQSKYWNSYKKHGTQFGLSGERTTATQTG